jgi:hypothetical protein
MIVEAINNSKRLIFKQMSYTAKWRSTDIASYIYIYILLQPDTFNVQQKHELPVSLHLRFNRTYLYIYIYKHWSDPCNRLIPQSPAAQNPMFPPLPQTQQSSYKIHTQLVKHIVPFIYHSYVMWRGSTILTSFNFLVVATGTAQWIDEKP